MQEVIPYVSEGRLYVAPDLKSIARLSKRVWLVIWLPIRWLLEAIFTPHPWQERIEETRCKYMLLRGNF